MAGNKAEIHEVIQLIYQCTMRKQADIEAQKKTFLFIFIFVCASFNLSAPMARAPECYSLWIVKVISICFDPFSRREIAKY